MDLDSALLRKILLAARKLRGDAFVPIEIPGYTDEEVTYHAKLAHDDGLIEASFGGPDICSNFPVFKRLTAKGHRYLEAVSG